MLEYHFPESTRILEIPIYRCTDDQHRGEEEETFEKWIAPFEAGFYLGGRTPDRIKIWEDHRQDCYRRMTILWDFNQIVGWIRLYSWPGSVRAYLFTTRQRVSKNLRQKAFLTHRGNFIEMRVYPNQSNGEILESIKTAILRAVGDHRSLRRCYVDVGILDTLGPHIDWCSLIRPPTPAPFDLERPFADLVSER